MAFFALAIRGTTAKKSGGRRGKKEKMILKLAASTVIDKHLEEKNNRPLVITHLGNLMGSHKRRERAADMKGKNVSERKTDK